MHEKVYAMISDLAPSQIQNISLSILNDLLSIISTVGIELKT